MTISRPGGSAVHLRGLTKKYGSSRVVDGFSAEIEPGQLFSLLGPSGSGKTTTLTMIAGFTPSDEGSIVIEGRDLAPIPPQRRGFGMVFQNYAIFPHLNVFDNVAFPLRARGIDKSEIASRVSWALDLVHLKPMAERFSRQLSGGQQQRVAIARAIVFHPKVVLMDEPLGALDKNLRTEMQTEIRELQQRLGMTVIYVTHDQEEALTMSDRVAIMNRGRIEQIGAPRDVYERPENSFVGKFLGEANLLQGSVEGVKEGVAHFRTATGDLFRAVAGSTVPNGSSSLFVRPEKLFIAEPSIPDVAFNQVTGKVVRSRFLGNCIRIDLVLAGGETLIVDLPNSRSSRSPAPDEQLCLRWPVADTLVLER